MRHALNLIHHAAVVVETAEAVDTVTAAAVAAAAVAVITKDGKRHFSAKKPSKEGFFVV